MAAEGPKILIIEDEQEIRRFLRARSRPTTIASSKLSPVSRD